MKKMFVIVFLTLLLFVQCKKNDYEIEREELEMIPVTFELSFNDNKSDFTNILPDGVINWGNDGGVERIYVGVGITDRYYIYSQGKNMPAGKIFELTGEYDDDNNKIVFSGIMPARYVLIDEVCPFFYFGNNADGRNGTNVEDIYDEAVDVLIGKKVDFSRQTGNIEDVGDYHIAVINAVAKGAYNDEGKLDHYVFELESFENIMAIAMLDLEGETTLGGTATQLKSYSIKWDSETEQHIEIFEYEEGGTYDVSGNPGEKSFIALLPTEETVTLECTKGHCEFGQGIKRNNIYVGKAGNSIEESLPLQWE